MAARAPDVSIVIPIYNEEGILREAVTELRGSAMLRAAFGDEVVEHYYRNAEWEITETDRVVTDFELQRLLERA